MKNTSSNNLWFTLLTLLAFISGIIFYLIREKRDERPEYSPLIQAPISYPRRAATAVPMTTDRNSSPVERVTFSLN